MSVGENIRRLRKEADLTQEELACRLGVARTTVAQWEGGWSMPRMGKLRLIAEVFHTSYSDIVSEDVDHAQKTRATNTIPLITLSDISQGLGLEPAKTLDHEGADMAPITLEMSPLTSIEVPESLLERHAHAIGLLMQDNSMDRVAPQGLAMVFDPSLKPTNGQIALLNLPDYGSMVRRLFRGNSSLMIVADSSLKQEDIIVPTNTSVNIYGTVVWVQSPHELS